MGELDGHVVGRMEILEQNHRAPLAGGRRHELRRRRDTRRRTMLGSAWATGASVAAAVSPRDFFLGPFAPGSGEIQVVQLEAMQGLPRWGQWAGRLLQHG